MDFDTGALKGCQIRTQSRSDCPLMGQIRDFFSSKYTVYLNLIWKSPGFVLFGANLTHFVQKSDIPDGCRINNMCYFILCFLCDGLGFYLTFCRSEDLIQGVSMYKEIRKNIYYKIYKER